MKKHAFISVFNALEPKKAIFFQELQPRKSLETLLLATWNIREFDSPAYGARLDESFYYIAEIISRFDLVAVQEVREDLDALNRLLKLLGPWWRFIATDVTEGKPGNRERLAFLYDARKVRFSGIAGEVVIPPVVVTEPEGGARTYDPSHQLYRTPFLCGFKAGWERFMLATVHIRYGENDPDDPERVKEISMVADFLAKRAREKSSWSNNIVLLGDFNIFSPEDVTLKAITDNGFVVPDPLQNVPPTNTGKKKRHYDQIAFMPGKGRLQNTGEAGVFNYYEAVFVDAPEDELLYAEAMGEAYHTTSKDNPRSDSGKHTYYRTYWRTHQMSDHLPMWVELKIDYSDEYLKGKAGN